MNAMEEEVLNRMEVEGQELLDGVDGREEVERVEKGERWW